jgi:hypothetical protein
MLKKIGLLSSAAVMAFAFNSASLNVNDKDIELGGRLDVGQLNYAVQPNTVFIGARYLSGNQSHSSFASNNNSYYEVSFLMLKRVPNTALKLGLGFKLNHTQANIAGGTRNFTSIPLGVNANYRLPTNFYVPLFLDGSIYYAPEDLSMSDANNFFAYRIHLDAEVIQNGYVQLGYRSINTNYKVNSVTYKENYNHAF